MLLRRLAKGLFWRVASLAGCLALVSVMLFGLLCAFAPAAEPPLVPLTVCEVLHDLPALDGKTIVVVGRYSFRQNGRWMGEQSCQAAPSAPPLLWLTEDAKGAPKPPGDFELDAAALHRKFAAIQSHTSLAKLKFGNPEYDRWAMVYGRIETRKGEALKQAAASLIFRGSGVLVFLSPDE
ncbi:MAG TPA: hypothetical protein VNY05_15230 [Candidatus Acidoferrales bacterium]|jgi:hypothetical protein|nr:hypothetical protein [Candidatus Acidoferrales bacterium]